MKRLVIILLILCPVVIAGHLQAQVYCTSSVEHHSYTNGGGLVAPPSYEFNSTSVYGRSISRKSCYSTAPMQVANGSIKTIASSVTGGVLLGEGTSSGGYIPPTGQTITPVIPGVPDTPLGEGWDVVGLLALLCAAYALYCYRREQSKNTMRG